MEFLSLAIVFAAGVICGLLATARRLRADGESTMSAALRVFSGGGPGPRQR